MIQMIAMIACATLPGLAVAVTVWLATHHRRQRKGTK
jgi:hypothetical protein